jgi:cellulose synthase/poly-beta-1,6-N-acetylglucosamine synthase-like glycosyltransferase
MQDIEFSVYGHLFQAGRDDWGTAGMGGNGQYNRLSALDAVADAVGPWRDRLTEDQDLGLRLIVAGWKGRQELRSTVDQQGPPKLRPLLRQRTRWSQGNLQAMDLLPKLVHAEVPLLARIELVVYVLMPFWQGIVGAALLAAVGLAAWGVAPFWSGGPTWQLALFYGLAFGGTVMGCCAARRGRGLKGMAAGVLLGHVYVLYTWLIWPVLARSVARQLRRNRQWAKTERVAIADAVVAS